MLLTSFLVHVYKVNVLERRDKIINGMIRYFNRIMLKLDVRYVIVAALDRNSVM